jgi:molybdopterin/thiamine biosynthesis adenylyltransferase
MSIPVFYYEGTEFPRPILLDEDQEDDLRLINALCNNSEITVLDHFQAQIEQLVQARNPHVPKNDPYVLERITKYNEPGTWVYYPWRKTIVHILGEEDFMTLRTNRNMYKIAHEEQRLLRHKTVLIVGLSVGASIAKTIAMERSVGHLILCDFDTAELSNLNRLHAGVHQLGMSKCYILAQSIAELDPYIKLTLVTKPLDLTLLKYILRKNKVDIIIDECDDLAAKWFIRETACSDSIPVLMETNDRGQIDIERFDLDSGRPIFHGRLKDMDIELSYFEDPAFRNNFFTKILDVEQGSERAKFSLNQIGKTIQSWPQLASSVTLGSGICADLVRKILLNKPVPSGRFFIDLDELIRNEN